MRYADRRERQVAVHEAAHVAMAYWNGFPIGKIELKRKGDETKGEGSIYLPPWPKDWRTDKAALLDLKVYFYKCLLIFSAGYLAEFMFTGEKGFWLVNSDMAKQTERTDFQVIREVAAAMQKDEIAKVLKLTHDHLAEPGSWGLVLDIASKLLKQRTLKGFPAILDEEYLSTPTKPEHSAEPLIKFILNLNLHLIKRQA